MYICLSVLCQIVLIADLLDKWQLNCILTVTLYKHVKHVHAYTRIRQNMVED